MTSKCSGVPLFLLIEMKGGFLVAEGRVELPLISPIY